MAQGYESIDQYISTFPAPVQEILQTMRSTISASLPSATEAISYQIPTFRINGKNVIHFAGWKHHVSLYPIPDGDSEYQSAVAPYVSGAGTLKFKLSEPIPYELIGQSAKLLAAQRFPDRP